MPLDLASASSAVSSAKEAVDSGGDSLVDPLKTSLSDPLSAIGGGIGGKLSEDMGSLDPFEHSDVGIEQTKVALSGPVPGLPGLSWNVSGAATVEHEKKGGSETTTARIEVSGGVKLSLWFLSLGMSIDGSVQGKVDGNKSKEEVIADVMAEFAKAQVADKLEQLPAYRAQLKAAFVKTRDDVGAAFDDLAALTDSYDAATIATAATGSWYLSKSPRERVQAATDDLQKTIDVVFEAVGYKAGGEEAKRMLGVGDLMKSLDALGSNAGQADIAKQIKAAGALFKASFSGPMAKVLSAFDAIDLAPNKSVRFTATAGVSLSASADFDAVAMSGGVSSGIKVSTGGEDGFQKMKVSSVMQGTAGLRIGPFAGQLRAAYQTGDETSLDGGFTLKTPSLPFQVPETGLEDVLLLMRQQLRATEGPLQAKMGESGFGWDSSADQAGRLAFMLDSVKTTFGDLSRSLDLPVDPTSGSEKSFLEISGSFKIGRGLKGELSILKGVTKEAVTSGGLVASTSAKKHTLSLG